MDPDVWILTAATGWVDETGATKEKTCHPPTLIPSIFHSFIHSPLLSVKRELFALSHSLNFLSLVLSLSHTHTHTHTPSIRPSVLAASLSLSLSLLSLSLSFSLSLVHT